MDFAVPANHKVKLKESKKRVKYQDLSREPGVTVKVTVILIVIGAFDTVTKGLLKDLEDLEIRGCAETI